LRRWPTPRRQRGGRACRSGTTRRSSIWRATAFGQHDDTYITIAELLAARGCATVLDWRSWTKGEFFTMIKAKKELVMKKHRVSYLAGFESATGHTLGVEDAGDIAVKTEGQKVGGDMMEASRKVIDKSFNGSKWQPDPLVYEGVPKLAEMDFIDDKDEKLYLDRLWLCAQVGLCPAAFELRLHTRSHAR
jgi:hypothetical protein